ncbi:transcription initiation factor TFIID subunit 4-like isoform X1 [Antennarius striatus]|uniref:transcription initiation factor TFIID subunit 4-like isoform X1 n=1 Tax=Antennarius striatus TaxID=241820 RepID=UPI0035B11392
MAGASDPLEDMLFSEVDEKAVSDLVGSLESQLAGQSNPAGKTDENGGAGSVAPANHHLEKALPASVGTTTLEQQQQGRLNKPEMHQEINSKDANPDKTSTSLSQSCTSSFDEPSTTSAAVSSGGSQPHRASITTLTASGVSTLASAPASISISTSTASSQVSEVSPTTGGTSTEASPPRKRVITPRRSASARIRSLNGAATTSRRNSSAASVSGSMSPTETSASTPTPNCTRAVTSSINTSTFTLSNANLPVGQSAIALDRGTPTIALHRLPSHIVASIAQNGSGTSVSALVQEGTCTGSASSSAPQESKTVTDTGASKADDCQSKIVMSNQSGSVNSVINTVPSAPCVVTPTTTTSTTTATTSTTTVTQPSSSATAASCVTAVATSSVCGTAPTTSVTTTLSTVRPTAPSPTPALATSAQSQPRPGLTAPQRIVAPQLIVRPPQQQTTIQLPPGFTIPPGMVLVRTELGQLVMVPQQALAQVQAQAQAQAQAQNNVSPRPATPTTGATFRVTTPQSPVAAQTTRQCPMTPAKMLPSASPTPPSPVLQTSSSSSTSSSSCPALRPKGPVAPVVAVTAPQPTPVVIAPQAIAQTASQPAQPPQTGISTPPGAQIVSQEMQENVKKCKNFLATLIKLASHNSPTPETSKNVKALVQDLLDAKIEPEEFTSRLQTELNSSPQPYLVPFLKKSLPALRLSLLNSQHSLTQPQQQGIKPAPGSTPPAIVTGPAVRIRHPNSVSTAAGALPAGTMGHAATVGMKTAATVGGQVRMPMVITQSVRAQGTMGKGAFIQAGKSPMGLTVQISGNQKNKLNDPGGGSFRDDDDINDVASMAGVNLNEESARILATNSELVGTQIRSCKDEAFLHPGLLHRRILETAKKFGVTEVPMEAVTFISHATQSRLRTVLEKVSIIAQHRLDSCKDDECYEQSADVRSQLRFFEQMERIEKQRKDEQEREILLKAAKSRSRQEDPEQARLKQKAKEMQQQELAQMRQRDANLTALAAIGPRKKRKVDSPGATPSGIEVSGSTMGSPATSSTPSTSSRQYTRQRITRVNLRDLIFYMEQERETAHSLLLYRALLK